MNEEVGKLKGAGLADRVGRDGKEGLGEEA